MGLRWILCGKGDAAIVVLQELLSRGDEVLAVANASDDGNDGWQASFRAAAKRLGVATMSPPRINEKAVVTELAAFRARALLSIQYEQILRANLFEDIGCPCLNLHFALLQVV